MNSIHSHLVIAFCLIGLPWSDRAGADDQPSTAPAAAGASGTPQGHRQRIVGLIADLDAERFVVREAATRQLAELAAQPDTAATVADELRRLRLDPKISFEVRARIEPILEHIASPAADKGNTVPPGDANGTAPSDEEIDALVAALADDQYSVRVGAMARLEWLLQQPQAVAPIFSALKRRLAEPTLAESARREVSPILQRARGAWLLTDLDASTLPKTSEAEIVAWLDKLTAPPAKPDNEVRHRLQVQNAERELLDLLARDEYAPTVERLVNERLQQTGLADEAVLRLEALAHWTKPAMVAEFWFVDPEAGDTPTGGLRQGGVQYLLVDVPSLGEGAERPSHFDRIDDRTAHCVSGNALSEGDYPVGVLFPHPQQESAFFHLVNLPTPRRRMAYEYELQRDERTRARELSRRTLDAVAERQQPLTPDEILMLGAVDREEFSRFVGPYFQSVDDTPFSVDLPANTPSGQTSRHGLVCLMLADRGTPTAIPGLLKAIETKRFLPPTQAGPCDMPWIAALAIASRVRERSQWPDVDNWLADLVERTDPLVLPHRANKPAEANEEGDGPETESLYPDLGATAAALLLRRHGIAPTVYGLEPVGRQLLVQVGCQGHMFTQPGGRQALIDWWGDHRAAPTTTRAAAALPRR